MPHTKEDWLALCVLMSIARNRKNNHRMKRASAGFYMDTESRHSYDSVHRLSDGFSAPVSTIILPSDDSPQMLSPSSSTRSLDRIAVENLLCNTCWTQHTERISLDSTETHPCIYEYVAKIDLSRSTKVINGKAYINGGDLEMTLRI